MQRFTDEQEAQLEAIARQIADSDEQAGEVYDWLYNGDIRPDEVANLDAGKLAAEWRQYEAAAEDN